MFTTIQACRICGNPRLESIVDLGNLALTGRFPLPRETVPVGPLELVRCVSEHSFDACGLVQLRQSCNPGELFNDRYAYRSSLNRNNVRHLESIVQRAHQFVTLDADDLVIDIGSNDGAMLGLYRRLDLDLLGVEPCGRKFAKHYPGHVRLLADFFSAEKVRAAVGAGQARVITSIATLHAVEHPLVFVRAIHDLLAKDGIWISEQNYLPAMIDNTSYDMICHENLGHYGLRQFVWLCDRANMNIVDVTVNEGKLQVIAARQDSTFRANSQRVARILADEDWRDFHRAQPYEQFRDRVFAHRDALSGFLEQAQRRGERVLGCGASTGGNVILQFCGLTSKHLACIGELDADKFGCVTPGSRIPIVSEPKARSAAPSCFLVLPWHLRASILRRETQYLANGGRFLFPLPHLEVVGQDRAARAA
jgi:NDP-4-keto-2,6-dideoxyhexose 3-C-methyltransferase